MFVETKPVRIAAVVGSLRPNSYSRRLLQFALEELGRHAEAEVDVVQPWEFNLALPGAPGADAVQQLLAPRIYAADGVILATPEYHGSYSSVMKALIDNMGYPSALEGKPVALIGAASGAIGAVKALEHLRSVCSHVGAIVLPYPVSVACVEQVIDEKGRCLVPELEAQLRHVGVQLLDYLRVRGAA